MELDNYRRIEEWLEKSANHRQPMARRLPDRPSDVIRGWYVTVRQDANNHGEGIVSFSNSVELVWSYHSVARQCIHCCKGDAVSQWERAILGCQNSATPKPIDYKFDKRDYVDELISYAKFHKIRRHKG